jgi:hypothetical protein
VVAIGSQEDDDNGFDSGSAYLYDALTGNEISKLLASDGAEFDLFGASVAIDGDVTVVGAKGYTESHTGSAYVYSGTTNNVEPMYDVNNDGLTNVQDLVIVVNFIMGVNTPTSDEFITSDANDDGLLNVVDLVIIVNYIVQ